MFKKTFLTVFVLQLFLIPLIRAEEYNYISPEATFETYKLALANKDIKHVKRCLTQASLDFGLTHNDTNKYPQILSMFENRKYKVRSFSNRAIIDFVPRDYKMSSVYLIEEGGEWKIDLKFINQYIIYDFNNNWHWKDSDITIEKRWILGQIN
jgi:hypothetical protein